MEGEEGTPGGESTHLSRANVLWASSQPSRWCLLLLIFVFIVAVRQLVPILMLIFLEEVDAEFFVKILVGGLLATEEERAMSCK